MVGSLSSRSTAPAVLFLACSTARVQPILTPGSSFAAKGVDIARLLVDCPSPLGTRKWGPVHTGGGARVR